MKNTAYLKIENDGQVTQVILNRPELHNAFNDEMISELTELFLDLAKDEKTRVVILKGEGKSFCAGADLNWMKKMATYSFEENLADAKRLFQMFAAIEQCPKPVIAQVQGAAMGGGVGLVAAVDMAFAQSETRFAFSEVKLGLIPAVISPFVIKKIGASAARELFLTGERFSSQYAKKIGLIQGAASQEEVESLVQNKVKLLLQASPEAIAASKELIQMVLSSPFETLEQKTAERIAKQRASAAGQEGMQAFFEKRPAKWVQST